MIADMEPISRPSDNKSEDDRQKLRAHIAKVLSEVLSGRRPTALVVAEALYMSPIMGSLNL